MRIAVGTWGSRGDIQPYLALARALVRAGHQVRLCGPHAAEPSQAAHEHGLDYHPLGPELADEAFAAAAQRAFQTGDPVKQVGAILDGLLLPALPAMYEDMLVVAGWADVVVTHFLQLAGHMAAERLGRPLITGTLVPTQLPSDYQPPTGLPDLGSWWNRRWWRLALAAMNAGWAPGVNRIRRQVGLPAWSNLAGDNFYSPSLNLVAVSPRLIVAPPDWSPRHQLTGYWPLTETDWQPSADVAAFVLREPRPVAIGFGSMIAADSRGLTRLVVEAVARAGVRAVIEPGRAGLGADRLPDSIMLLRGVPHDWLFRHVAAVVHHGGAGTTAAAWRAGLPSVIVPHIFDQAHWGTLSHSLGISPPPLARRRLTATNLAAAIRHAVTDDHLRRRAASIGALLRHEDGLARAVALIEAHVTAQPAPATTLPSLHHRAHAPLPPTATSSPGGDTMTARRLD